MGVRARLYLIALLGVIVVVAPARSNSPVPPDVFFTLSVSTRDAAVETRINGTLEDFLSGGASGGLVSSAPINPYVRPGENTIEFSLVPVEPVEDESASVAPALVAVLEIHLRGEIADTLSPGERLIFLRELTDEEAASLQKGHEVVIVETFEVDGERLRQLVGEAL